MIKIIKHGQKEFTHTCSQCGCEFTYEYEDIHTEAIRGLATNSTTTRYVTCPDCGNRCSINNSNIGWPWPNVGEFIPCNTPLDQLNPCSDCDWWKKMQQPGTIYVGDSPCTWCMRGPYKVTCDTTATTATNINDNSNTTGTVLLSPEDLKKYNLKIYGCQPTSSDTCPPAPHTSGSNAVKSCNSCLNKTKHSD